MLHSITGPLVHRDPTPTPGRICILSLFSFWLGSWTGRPPPHSATPLLLASSPPSLSSTPTFSDDHCSRRQGRTWRSPTRGRSVHRSEGGPIDRVLKRPQRPRGRGHRRSGGYGRRRFASAASWPCGGGRRRRRGRCRWRIGRRSSSWPAAFVLCLWRPAARDGERNFLESAHLINRLTSQRRSEVKTQPPTMFEGCSPISIEWRLRSCRRFEAAQQSQGRKVVEKAKRLIGGDSTKIFLVSNFLLKIHTRITLHVYAYTSF